MYGYVSYIICLFFTAKHILGPPSLTFIYSRIHVYPNTRLSEDIYNNEKIIYILCFEEEVGALLMVTNISNTMYHPHNCYFFVPLVESVFSNFDD